MQQKPISSVIILSRKGSEMNRRIIFMGTPQIAADVLQALLDADAEIVLAITQPDRKAGRKGQLKQCEVKTLALQHGIPVFSPEKIRTDYQPVLDADAALIVTCAYGQIVPQAVLDAPEHGCVNLHGSILPEYRGAAPIQRALWDGKTRSGMSLMKMEAGMDTGGVADVEPVEITEADTSTSLFQKMGEAAGRLIVRDLDALLEGNMKFQEQDADRATYAAKISKDDERIDLDRTDEEIFRQIRALSEEPGGYVLTYGKKIKLLKVRYRKGETPGIGVFAREGKKQFAMGGHEGLFLLDAVQLEGKPAMDSASFLNGKGRSLLDKKAGS